MTGPIQLEYLIDGAELRRRIEKLVAYLFIDELACPKAALVACDIEGLELPAGPLRVCCTYDPARLAGGNASDDDIIGD